MTGGQVFYDDVGVGEQIPTLTVTVDETQLFFFSAASYNGHRIHYDKEWARTVEGYDDVLVQGPLQAALLARELRRHDVVVELGDDSFRLKKSFEAATKVGAKYILIVGENEVKADSFALKNLATGEQFSVPRAELAGKIQGS